MDNSKGTVLGVVAVAIGLIAFGTAVFYHPVASTTSGTDNQNTGGERSGLAEFIDGIKPGDLNGKWIAKKLAPQTNSIKLYCNTSGHDMEADFGSATIITGETASSTVKLSLISTTTTAATLSTYMDFTTVSEGRSALFQGVIMATSSTATTTSSVYAAAAAKGNGSVLIANNSCVYGFMQQNTGAAGCTIAGTGVCESATSSNRGFNPIFHLHVNTMTSDRPTL